MSSISAKDVSVKAGRTSTLNIPKHIFKAYDIRGLVESELSEDLAYRVGRAFARLLRQKGLLLDHKQIVVGRDMRSSSGPYTAAVIRGLVDEGARVADIGLATTPLFNFACAHYEEHAGGIMITASHNPAEYNGFKMTLGDGLPVGKNNGMEEMYQLVCDLPETTDSRPGASEAKEVLPAYIDRILSLVPASHVQPKKVVIDYGNGMGSVTVRALCKKLPVEVVELYADPDGRFPNHEANPLKVETLHDLQQKVREVGADFGFALDGDADRIGMVDESGAVVDASVVGALIGREVLRAHPRARMLYDLRSSRIVPETWEEAGATTEMSVVGHALIKKMMKTRGAEFASELSLHLYFHDMYDVESSDLSLLYVLQLLSRQELPLSQLIQPLKKYAHSGEINFTVTDKMAVLARIENAFAADATRIERLDGLWMQLPWGWFNVRESNTEPLLRLNLETPSKEETATWVAALEKIIVGE